MKLSKTKRFILFGACAFFGFLLLSESMMFGAVLITAALGLMVGACEDEK